MSEDLIEWKAWTDMPEPWRSLQTVMYTEIGMARSQTYLRVMLRELHEASGLPTTSELFRVPLHTQTYVPSGISQALFPEKWYAAMQDSAARYFALRALQEPV